MPWWTRRRMLTGAAALAAGGCGSSAAATSPQEEPEQVLSVPVEEPKDPPAPSTGVRGTVILAPLRRFPEDLLDAIEERLRTALLVDVERAPRIALPRSAFYAPRKRYRADKLIDFLLTKIPDSPESTRILGLTDVDISTTKEPFKDWGIFGLGYMPGRSAVVSSFRLKRRAKNRAHLRNRVACVALHEVGHTFGLEHCPEHHCPMQDAEGSIKNTDTSDKVLGPSCQAKLEDLAPII